MSTTEKKSPRSILDLSRKMSTTQLEADIASFIRSLIPVSKKTEV